MITLNAQDSLIYLKWFHYILKDELVILSQLNVDLLKKILFFNIWLLKKVCLVFSFGCCLKDSTFPNFNVMRANFFQER